MNESFTSPRHLGICSNAAVKDTRPLRKYGHGEVGGILCWYEDVICLHCRGVFTRQADNFGFPAGANRH